MWLRFVRQWDPSILHVDLIIIQQICSCWNISQDIIRDAFEFEFKDQINPGEGIIRQPYSSYNLLPVDIVGGNQMYNWILKEYLHLKC